MRYRLAPALACLIAGGSAFQRWPSPPRHWTRFPEAIYEVFVRDFSSTGDLRGVTRGLDRIQTAGANVLWLMPDPSGRGPQPERSPRVSLLGAGLSRHQSSVRHPSGLPGPGAGGYARGMKLILDWAPNHTAWDHVWVREALTSRNERGELTVPRTTRAS